MWVGEPGQVGRVQVVGAWKVRLRSLDFILYMLWERLLELCFVCFFPLAEEWD